MRMRKFLAVPLSAVASLGVSTYCGHLSRGLICVIVTVVTISVAIVIAIVNI